MSIKICGIEQSRFQGKITHLQGEKVFSYSDGGGHLKSHCASVIKQTLG